MVSYYLREVIFNMLEDDKLFEYLGDIRADLVELKIHPENVNRYTSEIKDSLNRLFPDAECKDVILTQNTDKMFFGLVVMPIFSRDEIMKIVIDDDDAFKVKSYKVELDSKMLVDFVNITVDEILAFLVHDVGALVNTDRPVREVRFVMDKAIANSSTVFRISDYSSYVDLLGFGIKFSLRYLTSVFCKNAYKPNSLDDALSLTKFIKTGMTKLINNSDIWDVSAEDDRSVVMEWTIRLYANILKYRIPAIHTLSKCIETYPSKYMVDEMKNLIIKLDRIDDFSVIKESASSSSRIIDHKVDKKVKDVTSVIEAFEEIKALPVTSIAEAYDTLHRITCNMGITQYILENDEDLDNRTRWKLEDIYKYYDGLRNFMIDKKLSSLVK